MGRDPGSHFSYDAFLWPALAAASAVEAGSSFAAQFLGFSAEDDGRRASQEPEGATPSKVVLELDSVRLRDFTLVDGGVPTLLCTPLALHGAALADLAAGHSVVAALRGAGIGTLFVTHWRSAAAEMRFLGIDQYLADLNVLVDQIGGSVDLIGLCQGGWLSLVYAARFPAKVRKLILAGAPIDIEAGQSRLSAMAQATPMMIFQSLVIAGNGLVIGHRLASFWGNATDANSIREVLQTSHPADSPEFGRLEAVFKEWNSWTIDLPGRYYLEIVEKLYRRNELARGRFVALGQRIDLSLLRLPTYLLCGSADEVVAPEQLLAVERLIGTQPNCLRREVAPCSHLGLFMGKRTLEESWPKIASWMNSTG